MTPLLRHDGSAAAARDPSLPNPHWREELRASTGQSPMVRNYVLSFEDAQVFLNKVKD
ncbi:RNase adapter RapZ, partial [Aeromicrobium sp.]|uniref:RapZ C-terminal domain-containing protein n=1 Tax=Aeromicrobium sp. TaxID=1871063 RepID=UPI003513FC3A